MGKRLILMMAGVSQKQFSSGVLGPEMFYQLKEGEEDAYRSYFKDSSPTHLKKIEPKKVKKGRSVKTIVVKTFRTTNVKDEVNGGTYDTAIKDGLPYASKLVRASPTLDIWSFGCMLFRFFQGFSLFSVDDKDDDLKTPEDMLRVLTITDAQLDSEINKLSVAGSDAPLVKDLLRKILRVSPEDRLQSMDEVLNHGFFTGTLEGAMEKIQSQLNNIEEISLRVEENNLRILENTIELK